MRRVTELQTQVDVGSDEYRWANQMRTEQLRDLYTALLQVQSRADGAIEFGEECTHYLDADMRAEIARAVDVLQRLYMKGGQS